MYIYIHIYENIYECGVASISRLLKIVGLFCKRVYSAKESYNFKEPTNRNQPIVVGAKCSMAPSCVSMRANSNVRELKCVPCVLCINTRELKCVPCVYVYQYARTQMCAMCVCVYVFFYDNLVPI